MGISQLVSRTNILMEQLNRWISILQCVETGKTTWRALEYIDGFQPSPPNDYIMISMGPNACRTNQLSMSLNVQINSNLEDI